MHKPNLAYEEAVPYPVAGIDEAGCGPWAGPLVAAAVILPQKKLPPFCHLICDSKQLTERKRLEVFEHLTMHPDIHFGIGVVSVLEIDTLLLRGALPLAYKRAMEALCIEPSFILLDGIRQYSFNAPSQCIKQGDQKSLTIAAASIIAKVTRDRMMHELHSLYPHYKWNSNKGYGTKEHQKNLKVFGVCEMHRKSYAPIKRMLEGS